MASEQGPDINLKLSGSERYMLRCSFNPANCAKVILMYLKLYFRYNRCAFSSRSMPCCSLGTQVV